MYKKIVALKQQNPDLKVMLAVGGWNHPAAPFTQIVSNEASQKEFVENSYKFLKQHGFDGLDLGKQSEPSSESTNQRPVSSFRLGVPC